MTVNRKLTLAAVPLLLAVTVGAVALGSRAGAAPSEPPLPAPTPAPPFDDPATSNKVEHNQDADAWAAWATGAIQHLDKVKANDDGLRFVVDQEDATTDGNGKVRLCLNSEPLGNDVAEPADVDPAGGLGDCPDGLAAPYDPRVTSVMVDLAGNLDNPGNSPTESQTRFNVADGAVLVFLKNGEPVTNATVRFTYVAVGPE